MKIITPEFAQTFAQYCRNANELFSTLLREPASTDHGRFGRIGLVKMSFAGREMLFCSTRSSTAFLS